MTIREAEVTDESLFINRRQWLRTAAASALAATLPALPGFPGPRPANAAPPVSAGPDRAARKGVRSASPEYRLDVSPTSEKDATSYNNFYEFGAGKRDPAANAQDFKTDPWSIVVDGEVDQPGTIPIETLLSRHPLEERIYRLRCVEAWSLIVPWVGFPLADVIKRFEPTSKARYVVFETLHDPEQMPGQKRATLSWPYREGLRLDEAMHPLTLLSVGMYGKVLPNQNGAPIRLVVPWKYGFKSIKSIVRISFVKDRPNTTWNDQAADEYGFFANVNPDVDHPRWSQARERRLGEFRKRPTLPFNGYATEVANLYRGMDLRQNY